MAVKVSVYTGWKPDLLSTDNFPETTGNLRFLTEWHANADSSCGLNPIDLTAKNTGSSNCKGAALPYRPNAHYQTYSDRSWTRTAFYAQITSGDYPNLRAALRAGHPYKVADYGAVAQDIGMWGSSTFADVYLREMESGGPPPTLAAPQALRGWADMQRSINRHLPAALHDSARLRAHAQRQLARIGKVRF